MVKEFSYLGIAFSTSGSFSNAIQTLKDKANKAMYPLVDTVFKFSLGVPTSMNLFEKLIQPIVLYGSEIWGALSHHQLSSISKDPNLLCKYLLDSPTEKPKLRFSKLILGLKRNTSTLAVYGDLGAIPSTLNSILRVIKFWHRIAQLDDNTLVKKAFLEITSLPDNLSNWLNTVKTTLNLLGLSSIWNSPSSFSEKEVCRKLKNESAALFKKFWHSEVSLASENSNRNSKLRTYKTFKSNFKLETFLANSLTFEYRKVLSKFRCSDHKLLIEVGRHKGLQVEQRLCKMCHLNLVEDEFHFLTICPAYDNLRAGLLSAANVVLLDPETQFSTIMSSENTTVIRCLAEFIMNANKLRDSLESAT